MEPSVNLVTHQLLPEKLEASPVALERLGRGAVTHLLAQVALRRELKVVFDELFTVGGAEILFKEQIAYFLPEDADFHQLEKAVAEKGEIALGIYRSQAVQGRRLFLNPERKAKLNLAADDQVVVIALS